jgi:prepilin-type processing-associated H-X9-DG protein
LLENADGGAVFVMGMLTFVYAAGDDLGRRLAAVQLVKMDIATKVEVASAFAVTTTTLARWCATFAAAGVEGLATERTGPKGPSKLTPAVRAQIVELDGQGLSLAKIAAETGVSTATVRVALGRVSPKPSRSARRATATAHGLDDARVAASVAADERDEPAVLEPAVLEAAVPSAPVTLAPVLGVLTRPVPRPVERAAARSGDLVEAPVVLTEGAHLPLVGLLLALPTLEATGLLEVAARVLPPMRKGFYGLRATLLMGVFMALLREPRAQGATRLAPADLGRLLGLDRAPEVKTLRRKLAELASHGRGAELQAALGAHHVQTHPDAVGFLYLDGHVRAYSGGRQLPKTHIARMRIAGPATEETWIGDSRGDPVMVITAAPSQSLAAELHRLLPDLRALIGPDRRCTVVFDRGGYSPQVFAEIIAADFDLLTYFKGSWARADEVDFTTVDFTGPDGIAQCYQLAERPIVLSVPGQHGTAEHPATAASTITLRLIIRRSPDGHQTPILANRADLTMGEITYRMSNRWRQENYFKYGREHFALDALDSYADQPDDLTRLVPNPAKARAIDKVHGARQTLTGAHADVAHALDAAVAKAGRPGNDGKALVDPGAGLALRAAQADLATAKKASAGTPSHLPLGQVRPGSRLLETERKLLTHAIRMSAYNSESALARLLAPHYAHSEHEGRALLREAFALPGDLQVIGDTLHVRLDPASAPRRSKALAALCTELNDTNTIYPGTNLTLNYSVKGHPTAPE